MTAISPRQLRPHVEAVRHRRRRSECRRRRRASRCQRALPRACLAATRRTILGFVLLLGLWEGLVRLFGVKLYILPPPSVVLDHAVEQVGDHRRRRVADRAADAASASAWPS